MTETSHWILGLDLGPRCSGAIAFTRWLRARLGARVTGVYVNELWPLALSPIDGPGIVQGNRAEGERWLATRVGEGLDAAIDEREVRDALDAETELAEASRGSRGIVIGRYAAGDGSLVRLGRVARRLLRSLVAPVVVVPPELATDAFAGPVVLATDLKEASAAAARFAVDFAQRAGVKLICVHVGQPRWVAEQAHADPRWPALKAAYHARTEEAARAWARQQCPGEALIVDFGAPEDRLPAIAERLDASLLVLGSRRLGLVERVFVGSVASTVAATSRRPVAVVPSDA